MGEVTVDLGDAILRDTALNVRMKMGEMTVDLPARVRLDEHTTVWLGEANRDWDESAEDPNAPLLTIRGSIMMGEFGYHRHQ